jgi:DNA-binding NtrC family response regulator
LPKKPGVLIVDRSSEAREVLRTALARLNCNIYETDRAEVAAALAKQHHPDVIVLDLESHGAADLLPEPFPPSANDPPQWILLGTIRRGTSPSGKFVAINKPYHYQPLISKIEHMLQARRGPRRAGKAA